jgi:hypothetical protein
MSSILDAIEQQRAQSTARSVDYSELREKATSLKAQAVKQMLKGETTGTGEHATEMSLATIYYRMLEEYTGKPNYAMAKWNDRSLAFWKRVAQAQEKSGAEPEEYIRAQFKWFDKAFGKPPDLVQLTTELAIQRAADYAASDEKNTRRVVGAQQLKVPFADLMRQCEKQVLDICRANKMDRETFYRTLVKTGLVPLPKQFLDADPVWKKVA